MIFNYFLSKEYCSILFYLAKYKVDSLKEISCNLDLKYSELQDILIDFERMGLVECFTEGRKRYAEITPKGVDCHAELSNFIKLLGE